MRALIFAAGRGRRMGALARHTPKPLLTVAGRSLIEWQIERLRAAGIRELVINLAASASRIRGRLGDGANHGVAIVYSEEGEEPLETGGGMLKALPLLGGRPFIAINADVWCECDLAAFAARPLSGLAHLLLVPNPTHHRRGDFSIGRDGRLSPAGEEPRTFAGIGLYRPEILAGWPGVFPDPPRSRSGDPIFPLAPLLRRSAEQGLVSGEVFPGFWLDVGTPRRLALLRRRLERVGGEGSAASGGRRPPTGAAQPS
jgi:MurNAc alpha-1-phosphate uridylyltransferase